MKTKKHILTLIRKPSLSAISFSFFLLFAINTGLAQSPKKYFKHGYYEQAYVEAAHKQNKKVKLKEKYTSIIYKSYDIIYERHYEIIASSETDWKSSHYRLTRMEKFRKKVRHPGVLNNLKDISLDSPALDELGKKFNQSNQKNIAKADSLEAEGKYDKAIIEYNQIKKRHLEAKPLSTLQKRLDIINYDEKIQHCNQKIGDQYIQQAREELNKEEPHANTIISLVTAAKGHRPLSQDEEELLRQGQLIKANDWMKEADEMMATRTKKNMRLAFEKMNDVRAIRSLTAEEEERAKLCKNLGTTKVLLKVSGNPPIHTAQILAGILNKRKSSKWLAFYADSEGPKTMDFIVEISENEPTVVMGELQKEITQNTETVEYWEEVTDAQGKVTKVKKTREAVAVIATLKRDKTAELKWAVSITAISEDSPAETEVKITEIIVTKETASFVSGDILGKPENSTSDVDFNSQPFPTDQEMRQQVTAQYLDELHELLKNKQLSIQNITDLIPE